MKRYNIKDKYKNIFLDIIHKELPNCKVYLIGSRARSTNRPGADIDLVLDNQKPIYSRTLTHLYINIEDSDIPLFVDLVDFNTASDDFKQSIEKDKILWKK